MGLLRIAARVRGPAALLLVWTATVGALQAVSVRRDGAVLRVQAPAFRFIEGDTLARLRDGQALQFTFKLAALARAGGEPVAETEQRFNVSFDLWEERFAVTRLTAPKRSVSHLGAREADVWCVESLMLPLSDLARFGRDGQFWIRLGYEIDDPAAADRRRDQALTLRRLIDYLSQRPETNAPRKPIEAGPFRVPG
jgi:hypothetical protein